MQNLIFFTAVFSAVSYSGDFIPWDSVSFSAEFINSYNCMVTCLHGSRGPGKSWNFDLDKAHEPWSALKCYQCYSTQEGCGKELSIRLQRLGDCPSMGKGAGENFCVKVIEMRGSEEFYTRECLHTLQHHTEHRLRIPTVQRHGYCEPARNDDPYDMFNEDRVYCFCNDWNGCNSASTLQLALRNGLLIAAVGYIMRAILS